MCICVKFLHHHVIMCTYVRGTENTSNRKRIILHDMQKMHDFCTIRKMQGMEHARKHDCCHHKMLSKMAL